jgi:hypothetical protein
MIDDHEREVLDTSDCEQNCDESVSSSIINDSDDEFVEEPSEEDSTNDNHHEDRGQVSSDSSPDTSSTKKRNDTSAGFHNDAVEREQCRDLQRKLYNQNRGFPYSVDVANAIKRVMKEKVYPRLKILSDTESQFLNPDFVGKPVDQSRIICDLMFREIEMPDTIECKVRFWITYRSLVKNQLVKFRSNCVEDLKREYFRGKGFVCCYCWSKDEALYNGYLSLTICFNMSSISAKELLVNKDPKDSVYLEGCDNLMTILSEVAKDDKSPIINLRSDEDTKLAFFFFAREFLPCVVKRLVFRQNKFVKQLSEFVTVSDEAFTLFLLENNVARWNAMFMEGTKKSDDQMPPQKFQSSTTAPEDKRTGKDGYGLQAVLRYNEYYQDIERTRRNIDREYLEKELMERMEALDDGRNSRTRKPKRRRDGELNIVDEHGAPVRAMCELNDLY